MSNVTHIGDWAIQHQRKWAALEKDQCAHKRLQMEDRGEVIKCVDCGVQVSAYWALTHVVEEFNRWTAKFNTERAAHAKVKEADLHLIAAKKVEQVWRSRSMVPVCPHCGTGILPEDGLGGARISREIELRRREVAKNADGPQALQNNES